MRKINKVISLGLPFLILCIISYAGITTITQGLAKIFYFDHFKPGIAKLKH